MLLSPRAERLISPLRDVLRGVGDVVGLPTFRPESDSRTISISASSTTAYIVGKPLLRHLASAAPYVTLRMSVAPALFSESLFSQDNIDLALLADSLTTTHPRKRLYTDEWVVVMDKVGPRDILDREGGAKVITPASLTSRPHIVFDSKLRTSPYAHMDRLSMSRRVVARVSDFLLIPHLVSGSDALAIVQRRVAERLCTPLGLSLLRLPFENPSLGIDMVWNPRLGNDPMVGWLQGELGRIAEDLDN